jgi:hypothetical protein
MNIKRRPDHGNGGASPGVGGLRVPRKIGLA